MKRGIRTFVNVNNHYEGSAPLTIQRFVRVLEGRDIWGRGLSCQAIWQPGQAKMRIGAFRL